MVKRRKKKYTKSCRAGVTKDMWFMLTTMKIKLNKSKAQIIREALTEYYAAHVSADA